VELTLYLAPGASSMAPHIALRQVGAEFAIKHISFARKENRSAEYLAVNPEGKVPTLAIDGRPLTEVAAILFWIARNWPEAHLLPEGGAEAEAQALSWMSFIAATLHPAGRAGTEAGQQAYAEAERRLGTRGFTVGERLSVVDIHLFRLFWRFHPVVDLSRTAFPALWAHHDRMMELPSVIETIRIESGLGYELPVWPPRA